MKSEGLAGSLFVFLLALPSLALSQTEESALFPPLEWRTIGPDRGGRSIAVAGHRDRPFEDGANWSSLSFNLPDVPVTGLVVEERDLVISTHGRSFWVLDDIETLRQIEASVRGSKDAGLRIAARSFLDRIAAVEGELYQVRNQSPKDKIAFPIKLNDRLTGLRSRLERGDAAPTEAYRGVFEELSAQLAIQLKLLEQLLGQELPRLNQQLANAGLPTVVVGEVAPITE